MGLDNSFAKSNPSVRSDLKKILKSITGTMLNSAHTVTQAHEIVGRNQDEIALDQKLQGWHRELSDSLNSFKKRFGRLINELKYFIRTKDEDLIELDRLSSNVKNSTGEKHIPYLMEDANALKRIFDNKLDNDYQYYKPRISRRKSRSEMQNSNDNFNRKSQRSLEYLPKTPSPNYSNISQKRPAQYNNYPYYNEPRRQSIKNTNSMTGIKKSRNYDDHKYLSYQKTFPRDSPRIIEKSPDGRYHLSPKPKSRYSQFKSPATRIRRISVSGKKQPFNQFGEGRTESNQVLPIKASYRNVSNDPSKYSGSRKSIKTRVVVDENRKSIEPMRLSSNGRQKRSSKPKIKLLESPDSLDDQSSKRDYKNKTPDSINRTPQKLKNKKIEKEDVVISSISPPRSKEKKVVKENVLISSREPTTPREKKVVKEDVVISSVSPSRSNKSIIYPLESKIVDNYNQNQRENVQKNYSDYNPNIVINYFKI